MATWPISGNFSPDDGRHVCQPTFPDMKDASPPCAYCGAGMTRIAHAPGHTIDGKPCGFPERWRYCFIRTDKLEGLPFWQLPSWRNT